MVNGYFVTQHICLTKILENEVLKENIKEGEGKGRRRPLHPGRRGGDGAQEKAQIL